MKTCRKGLKKGVNLLAIFAMEIMILRLFETISLNPLLLLLYIANASKTEDTYTGKNNSHHQKSSQEQE